MSDLKDLTFPEKVVLGRILRREEKYFKILYKKKLRIVRKAPVRCMHCGEVSSLSEWALIKICRDYQGPDTYQFAISQIECPSLFCQDKDNSVAEHPQHHELLRYVVHLGLKEDEIFDKIFFQRGSEKSTRKQIK